MQQQKITVEDTNTQAFESKLFQIQLSSFDFYFSSSIISKGYIKDEFAKFFLSNFQKRDVIIHRGYWSRVWMMREIAKQFLKATDQIQKQIISLGAGYDTLFFNLKAKYPDFSSDLHYYEIDLPSVIQTKIKKIQQSKELQQQIKQFENAQYGSENDLLHTTDYTVFTCNICDKQELFKKLENYGIDYSQPTLIFIECVMAYIEPKCTNEIFSEINNRFEFAKILDYEMFNGKDQFGKMMIRNFEIKGCPLIGIDEFESLELIKARYKKLGYEECEIYTMLDIYNKYVNQSERQRIEKIEFLDELEEWNIMQSHYFISLATCYSSTGKENKKYEEINKMIKINQTQ